MKQRTTFLLLAVAIVWGFVSCSKNADSPDRNDGDNYNYGPGNLFIKQGTEGITRIDMRTGVLSNVIGNWIGGSWDISWDGTKGLKQLDSDDGVTTFVIFDVNNGSTIKEFDYETPGGDDAGLASLSPNGNLLALRPMFDEGLVILDMNGNILRNISGYGSTHKFEYLDPICWEAGGTILFKKDGGLWRTSADFNRATKVRDIPFSDWRGYASASPDGKKIALSLGNHIWLMNADGSDFHQITESAQKEVKPYFSPDSKYLAIAANSRAGVPGSGTTAAHLCLVPADGQVYRVSPGEDNRVIQVAVKGEGIDSRGLGKAIVGDFVWR